MKTRLVIMSVLNALFGLAGVIPACFSVMMFDAPGSTTNPATIVLFIAVASFPLVCFGSIAIGWAQFREGDLRGARLATLAPLVNILAGAIAALCLQTIYAGKLGG